VVVPASALQTVEGQTVVYVQTPEGFEPRPVELGRRNQERVEILSGLQAGERYAATNTFTLKAEQGRGLLEHAGHAH
jgi:cobalt-zinc-cadmium efflux system membrane fusion protein